MRMDTAIRDLTMTDYHPDDPEFFRQVSSDTGDDRARNEAGKPNGHVENWHELPAIDQADIARWKGRDPPELIFTIEDLVSQGMVTLLTSVGGAGKTLLLQTACTLVAAGQQAFLGKRAVVGKAAGLFAEDSDDVLHLRQTRINERLGIAYDQIAGRLFVQSYFGLPAQLWRRQSPTRFMEQLEVQLARIDTLRLLTFDNAALLFSGDENSRLEVTEFLALLNGLADRLSIGIILSAHASKTSDGTSLRVSSGSTAWVNACRSVLELKAAEKDQGPSLVVIKAYHAVRQAVSGSCVRGGHLRRRPSQVRDTEDYAAGKTCLRLRHNPRGSGHARDCSHRPEAADPMRTIGRWLSAVAERADYVLTLARLWLLDRLAPMTESPVDRAIREEAERLRKAFPWLDELRRN
jgi:hypothetical protein